jgi:hypothetical protein
VRGSVFSWCGITQQKEKVPGSVKIPGTFFFFKDYFFAVSFLAVSAGTLPVRIALNLSLCA